MIIPDIISQHAEESAFLWRLRDIAVRAPHYSLDDIIELDERIEAHIDGLRIAGEPGWAFCEKALSSEEAGEVFAASVLAFESEDNRRVDLVLEAGCASEESYRGLVSAVGWLSNARVQRWIPKMFSAHSPIYDRLAITACTIHRQDPGQALAASVDSSDEHFQARVLRAVGELKRRDLLPALRKHFGSENVPCRFWAAWSALVLGDRTALAFLKTFSTVDSPFRERALQLVLRVMDIKDARNWLNGLTQYPDSLRYLIIGEGVVGDPASVPWLISQLEIQELARVAGDAFGMITGVDFANENLEGEWPEGFEVGPTENPEDEDVDMDPDEGLLWPDPNLVQEWWEKNKTRFRPGTRYLGGHPITVQHCRKVLLGGYQHQRRAAALELALLEPEKPLFNTSAKGSRQKKMLRAK